MKALIAIVLVMLLVAITAIVVLWITPPGPATFPQPASGASPSGWQRVAGAAAVGAGAYYGRSEGAAAGASVAQGIGWL